MSRLQIKNLSKRFGTVTALKGVDLTIEDRGFIAILGPSGCGKTTLLRLLAGLEMATGGSIEIDDRDVSATPPEKRNIGLMFQSYALFPHMTVAENLEFPMLMRRNYSAAERQKRISNALDLVRLPAIGERRPKQLSGGQQQRVALARAIIDEPSLLLLDEPLSNLDAQLREEMQIELLELRRKIPITTVLVTHDQAEGLTLADRVVVMRDGQIEQAGAPREVYHRPETAFVADFLGGANLIRIDAERDGEQWIGRTTHGLKIAIPEPPKAQPGPMTLMIRQEHLRLLPAGEPPNAELSAIVAAVAFRGEAVQVALDADGARLRLIAPASTRLKPGDRVRIGWSFEHAHLIAA